MSIQPQDHAEAVAIFRAMVIGPVVQRTFSHGELAAGLRELSEQRFRPPEATSTRTYSVPTLERWVYAYRADGLAGLRPRPRSDRGFAQDIPDELRELLLDIRREYPNASVPLIRQSLIDEGRMDPELVSEPTLRRLYAAHGLSRRATRTDSGNKTRRRWQADRPGAIWHGDVCHVTHIDVGGQTLPIRVHGLLDDASRNVIALEAHTTEKELDMLGMLVDALRVHPKPDSLYLDNGSTYRGEILQTVCARLGIALLHARPYDPQARGKMERFWRTLREGCLEYIRIVACLADVHEELRAWVDKRYRHAPHSSLFGKSPAKVYATRPADRGPVDEATLRTALTIRSRRRVSNDNVLTLDGFAWELDQGFLAGQIVTVAHCFLTPNERPWVEHEGKRLALHPLDPVKNARRKRALVRGPTPDKPQRPVDFAPNRALLAGRREGSSGSEGGGA
jgi:transposase InsO family protein